MKISTITALSNGAPWIAQTLDSIAAQSRPPDEIIVIDDESTDGGRDIVRRYPLVRLLTNPGRGANAARRHGIEQACHPWVTVVDQDDVWHPEHLARVSAAAEKSPDIAGFVSGAVRFGGEALPEYRPWGHGTSPLDPWANFPVAVIGCSAQVLFRRTALIDLGGWETRFPGVGDVHAWLTLTARRPFLQLEGETVGHRQHRASAQGPVKRRNRWDYCDRYLSAAQDRLPLRLRYHQSEAVRTRGRLRLARYLFAWRFADAMLGPSQSTPLGIRVDPLFAEESPEAQQTLLEQAFWFFPVEEEATRLTRTVGLIRLWQRCPREAPHLRAALRAYLQRRVSGALHALGA